ncbi:hypothetical protein EIP91_004994 [Steccherinum ochraceum]|uniref:RNB domain-containing protein n=1 Tax=Steccherinum ochraceum TaxID=92696 RepID=A0A4R0RAS3_9APHY|nr:hypothetical protein EIP91_004994 [Steccherinum ochraceum]
MHRHVGTCATRTYPRALQLFVSSGRSASTSSRARQKLPPQESDETRFKPLRKVPSTNNVKSQVNLYDGPQLASSFEALTSLQSPAQSLPGGRNRGEPIVGRQARLATSAQQAFDAAVAEEDVYEDTGEVATESFATVVPGTFVEIRRNQIPMFGIVLRSSDQMIGGFHALLITGDVQAFLPTDVHFAIPNAVSPKLVDQCGEPTHDSDLEGNEQAFEARIHVLKTLRSILTRMESEYVRISRKMPMVYDKFRAKDAKEWSQVTTVDKSRLSSTSLLAVHQHLMQNALHFMASPDDFLLSQRFFVRPASQVEDIEAVRKMISKKSAPLQSFVRKAKGLIADGGIAELSTSGPPSIRPHPDVFFSQDEQPILRFLKLSAQPRRFTQEDLYSVLAVTIIRMVENTSRSYMDSAEVANFLVRLGLSLPWADYASETVTDRMTSVAGPSEQTLRSMAQSNNPVMRTLGPGELLPHDFTDSIRHDFGDLPVYVIDDSFAQELDDGLSVEPISSSPNSFWIHVHIADPTSLLPPTHEIARAAQRMSTTFYFPHKTMPMLPQLPGLKELSLGSASESGRPERVMTSSFRVGDDGAIVEYKVRAGLVRNVQRLLYDDVNAALGIHALPVTYPFGGAPSLPPTKVLSRNQLQDLKQLVPIVRRMVSWRVKQGAAGSVNHKAIVSVTSPNLPSLSAGESVPHIISGFPNIAYALEDPLLVEQGSRQIVSECMKAASRVTSMFMRDRGLPAIRRSGGEMTFTSPEARADVLALRDDNGFITDTGAFRKAVAAIAAGSYTVDEKGHDSLGIPATEGYVHFTSPLRRFVDMHAHWQIKHSLAFPDAPSLFDQEWTRACAQEMNSKGAIARKADNTSRDFWALSFIERWRNGLEKRGDLEDPLQSLVAIPTGTLRLTLEGMWSALCFIPTLGIRGTLVAHSSNAFALGQPVGVKVEAIRLGFSPRLLVTPK